MDELDSLEDIYFGKTTMENKRRLTKLRGLYKYCYAMKLPAEPSLHVPYNQLINLAKVAPKGTEGKFITEKLQLQGYLQQNQTLNKNLEKRVEYAFNWIKTFEGPKETVGSLTTEGRNAITELVKVLRIEGEPEKIQNAIFSIAKTNGLQPRVFFKIIYTILLGVPHGPILGQYITARGKQNVIDELERALERTR
jgi:lysyl-tRNA synthetase class 1